MKILKMIRPKKTKILKMSRLILVIQSKKIQIMNLNQLRLINKEMEIIGLRC